MKFGQELLSTLTPEWRSQYLRYEELKEMLYELMEEEQNQIDQGIRSRRNTLTSDGFFDEAKDELDKINLFYHQKLAEADRKFRQLCLDLAKFKGVAQHHRQSLESVEVRAPLPSVDGEIRRPRRKRSSKRVSFGEGAKSGDEEEEKEERKSRADSLREYLESITHRATRRIRALSTRNMEDHEHALNEIHHKYKQHYPQENYRKQTKAQLRLAFSEFYLFLVMIQRYQQQNVVGFRKINKKHDKLLESTRGHQWFTEHVVDAELSRDRHVDLLIEYTEKLFITELYGGNRSIAMKRLRVPPLDDVERKGTTFRLGFMFGVFVVLIWAIADSLVHNPPQHLLAHLPLFRGLFILYLMIFLVGLNVSGWRANGVNHVLIFELDPRIHLSSQALMTAGMTFINGWAICLLGYVHSANFGVNDAVFPMILAIASLAYFLFMPKCVSMLFWSSRKWFLTYVKRCLFAPFYSVRFADFWLADQMTSLVPVFLDIEYIICYAVVSFNNLETDEISTPNITTTSIPINATDTDHYAQVCNTNFYGIRSILAALPFFMRAMQCLRRYVDSGEKHPHLSNFGKYSSAFLVVGADLIQFEPWMIWIWVGAQLFSSTYKLAWDVLMDWGLFEKSCLKKKHRLFLREELIYRQHTYYYLALISNTILRYTWTMQHKLNTVVDKEVVTFILGTLECLRRYVWNYFRLENEHLNNCGDFRAVRDISIKPLNRKRTAPKALTAWASNLSLGRRINSRHSSVMEMAWPVMSRKRIV